MRADRRLPDPPGELASTDDGSSHGPECACTRCRGFEPGNEYRVGVGNDLAVRHGAFSTTKLEPRIGELTAALREIAPTYRPADEPLVRLCAGVLARIERAQEWLAEQELGIFRDKAGELQPVLRALSTWENSAARYLGMLGCSPVTRAQLGLDVAATQRVLNVLDMHEDAARERAGGGS